MEKAIKILDGMGVNDIVPLFISIDPKRDTPHVMKLFKEGHDPRLVMLTGDEKEIEKVAKDFRVYYSAPDIANAADGYQVDHSIFFYLMDREGKFLEFYGKNLTAEEIASGISKLIKTDRISNKQNNVKNKENGKVTI